MGKQTFIFLIALLLGQSLAAQDFDFYKRHGAEEYEQGNYLEAAKYYTRAIQKKTTDPEVYLFRGLCLIELGHNEEALKDFNEAIGLDPANPEYNLYRGVVYHQLGKYSNAINDFTQAINKRTEDASVWELRAGSHYANGNMEEAAQDYAKAIESDPDNDVLWYNRGSVYFELKDYEKARKDFNKAVSLNPSDADYWGKKGISAYRNQDYEQAIKDFTEALDIQEVAYIYQRRGASLYMLGKYMDAIRDYRKAMDMEPGEWSHANYIAVVLQQMRKFEESLIFYEKALELTDLTSDNAVVILSNMASVLNELGRYREAREKASQSINTFNQYANAYNHRAFAEHKLGSDEQALKDAELSVALDPDYGKAYFTRGLIYEKQGRFEEALADLKKARELIPGFDPYFQYILDAEKRVKMIRFTKTPPEIRLVEPLVASSANKEEGYTLVVVDDSLAVEGRVFSYNDIDRLTINRQMVKPDTSGFFSHLVLLQDGLNTLRLASTDEYNNSSQLEFLVEYDRSRDEQFLSKEPPMISLLEPLQQSNKGFDAIPKEAYQTADRDIIIQGIVSSENQLEKLFVNDDPVSFNQEGFFFRQNDLKEGKNIIRIEVNDQAGLKSEMFVLVERTTAPPEDVYSKVPPRITLSAPLVKSSTSVENFRDYDFMTEEETVRIQGKVSTDNEIGQSTINNQVLAVSSEGTFILDKPLEEGDNRFEIRITDDHDQGSTLNLLVRHHKKKEEATPSDVPPSISLAFPEIRRSRGFKVVSDYDHITGNSRLLVKGTVSHENPLDKLAIDGNEVETDDRGNFEFHLELDEGSNLVTVLARDVYELYDKLEFSVKLDPRRESTTEAEKTSSTATELDNYYALLIANEDYDDPNVVDLSQPVADAAELNRVLKEGYGFREENISFLKNPDKKDFLDVLDNYARMLGPEDNLMIFYAGHGYWDEDLEKGYWLMKDAVPFNSNSWVSNSELINRINAISTRHILLIADACFSGALFKSRGAFINAGADIMKLYHTNSRKAMTSGSLKHVPDESVFHHSLMENLNNNNKEYLTGEELFISLKKAVILNTENIPQYGQIPMVGGMGGDFIFVRFK